MPFLHILFPFTTGKMVLGLVKKTEGTMNFAYNFLITCRYLNFVKKKSEDNFIAKRKCTRCYNTKTLYERGLICPSEREYLPVRRLILESKL